MSRQGLEDALGAAVMMALLLIVFAVASLMLRRRDGRWPGQAVQDPEES